jgi:hypothetical protein
MAAAGYTFYRMPYAFVIDLVHEELSKKQELTPIEEDETEDSETEVNKENQSKSEEIENKNAQKVIDVDFVTTLWNKFYFMMKSRYNITMPYPLNDFCWFLPY